MAATAVLEVYTEDGKMAKRCLSPGGAMEGAHARLRDLAGEYRH